MIAFGDLWKRWAAGTVVVVASLLPSVAAAHAFLVTSAPNGGARLHTSPRTLRLQFTEAVVSGAAVHLNVKTGAGRRIELAPPVFSDGDTQVRVGLPALANGIYLIDWQVVSAADGHTSAGQFAFAVGRVGTLPASTRAEETPISLAQTVTRWLLLLGLSLSGGGLVATVLIWEPLAKKDRAPHVRVPALRGALVAGSVGAMGGLLFFVQSIAGESGPRTLLDLRAWNTALHTSAGLSSIVALLLILYALLALLLLRAPIAAAAAVIGAAIAAALETHPASRAVWWGAVAIVSHVTLAVLWSGALIHLTWVLSVQRRQISRNIVVAAVRRYTRLALWSVILVLASGSVASLTVLGSVAQLVTTLYGRVLLIKLAIVAVVLCYALGGRLRSGSLRSDEHLEKLGIITSEGIALIAVLGVAALLSNVAPPAATPAQGVTNAEALLGAAELTGPTVESAGRAGWLEVYLTASARDLRLSIIGPGDVAPAEVRLVSKDTRGDAVFVDPPNTENDTIGLAPRPCGPGCLTVPYAWHPGVSRVHLQVDSKRWKGGAVTFDVSWPPAPIDRPMLERTLKKMRAQPLVRIDERSTSGPGATAKQALQLSGAQLVAGLPYSSRVENVRSLPPDHGFGQLVISLPASHLWVHVWLDSRNRLRRQLIIAPGHEVDDRFTYPARAPSSLSP